MKMFSRIGISIYSVGLLFIGLPSESLAVDFSDIGGIPQRAAIEYLQSNDIVGGYKDGTFLPTNQITRAEFLKIVMQTAIIDKKDCSPSELENIFPDVSTSDWFAQVVCNAKKTGIIKGHADGLFRPNNTIELSEAAKIVALSQEITLDDSISGQWYEKYLEALSLDRVITAEEKKYPAKRITRGEMAEMAYRVQTGTEIVDENITSLPSINSCIDLSSQLEKGNLRQNSGMNSQFRLNNLSEEIEETAFDAPMAIMNKSAMSDQSSAGASSDFSTTNIQEFGVDEADIVKNDGSHIFIARGEDIRIVKAYPSNVFAEDSKISVAGMNITELYLDGDILTVLGTKNNFSSGNTGIIYEENMMIRKSIMYIPDSQQIEMRTFDVSDRTNPIVTREFSVDGNLVSSRKIGDIVYLISTQYLPAELENLDKKIPQALDGKTELSVAPNCGSIDYFPNFKNNSLLTVSAINTNDSNAKVSFKNILGAGSEVYASPENLFVVQQNQHQVYRVQSIIPPRSGWDWDQKTDIYKFSLDGLNVDFIAQGSVDGRVLNQYSMSEYEENFRIATQVGQAWGETESENMVSILGPDLKLISSVGKIAPGENLKSARFMGQRAFLVTFKTVDPLFVLDLDPTDPKVLGELKIPGWSDYLHPINENYLIGFGKEVDETIDADKVHSDNAVYYTAVLGMKLAIFDVSDLANPKEIHKTVIGDRGTESDILYNPKSLFFDASRKLIGFPISIQTKSSYAKDCSIGKDGVEVCTQNHSGDQFETTFSGAQVYSYSIDSGFNLLGSMNHFPESSKNFWDNNYTISRVVRIGENFYSISNGLVKLFNNKFEEEKTVSFLGDIACEKILDESTCRSRLNCQAKYSQPICPEGKICTQVLEFESCVTN